MNAVTLRAFNALQGRLRRHFGTHLVPDYYGRSAHKQADLRQRQPFRELALQTFKEGRTLLYYDRLFTIYQAIQNAIRTNPPGQPLQFAEVGVFRGGTTAFIMRAAQQLGAGHATIDSVDTFEGHPRGDLKPSLEPAHNDAALFRNTGYEQVREYLRAFPNATVHQGRIQDKAPALEGKTFSFVHLDVDIYEPTAFGLDFFAPRLRRGGVIVVDDFGFTTCPGANRAVNEFITANPGYVGLELLTGQYVLVRHSDGR
jgi:O-methyltransferase